MVKFDSSWARQQAGISIIEIMITLTLGLFIIGGMLYTFMSSRTLFTSNDAIAKIQEDGRMAIERLTREIRQAGFMGCSNSLDITPVIHSKLSPPTFVPSEALRIYGNGGGWGNPTAIARVNGTDVIQIKGLSACTAKISSNMTGVSGDILVSGNPCGWAANQVLVIADCTNIDIFTASSVTGTGTATIGHLAATNTDANLSKVYGKEAMIFGYGEKTFFVGIHPTLNLPMLYETTYDGINTTTNDVVANVYDLQVPALLRDSNADGVPDATEAPPLLGAVVNPEQLLSLRVRFSVRSESDNVGPSSLTYNFNGAAVTDKRIKRDFTTVIGLRNRLP